MPKSRKRRVIIAVALVVILLAVAIVVFARRRGQPGHASGDPLDIRLLGIARPDVLVDPNGKVIDKTLGLAGGYHGTAAMGMSQGIPIQELRRVFAFDLPNEEIKFRGAKITPAGRGNGIGSSVSFYVLDTGDPARLYIQTSFKDKYKRSFPFLGRLIPRLNRDEPVRAIDLRLFYWYGPPGESKHRFAGPFASGTKADDANGTDAHMTTWRHFEINNRWGTRLQFDRPISITRHTAVLAHDQQGKRRLAERLSWEDDAGYDFVVWNLLPGEITSVSVGEKTRQRLYRNINIESPSTIDNDYYKRLREAIKHSEKTDSQFRMDPIDTSKDALAAIDVVMSPHIWSATWKIAYRWPGPKMNELPQKDQERILRRAREWVTADDPRFRHCAVRLGLPLAPEEFTPPALLLLEETATWGWSRELVCAEVAEVFNENGSLLPESALSGIERFLEGDHLPRMSKLLVDAVAAAPSDYADSVLEKLASDERPYIWWHALSHERTIAALGARDGWTEQLRARRFIVEGLPQTEADDAVESLAVEMLPEVLTPQLQASDATAFDKALRLTLEHCERKAAEAAIVRFLREVEYFKRSAPGIAAAVAQLNTWHGIDIGGITQDLTAPAEGWYKTWLRNWAQVRCDALDWLETGRVNGDTDKLRRAKPGDLRMVFKFEPNTEDSFITSVLSPKQGSDTRMGWGSRLSVFFTFHISALQSSSGIVYVGWIGSNQGGGRGGNSFSVRPGDLPANAGGTTSESVQMSQWLEAADDPESVLSGTKVFADWWERYGPDGVELQKP